MLNDVISEYEAHLKKATEALRHHLASIRTGRASSALVEHLHVDAYGTTLPLNQLGQYQCSRSTSDRHSALRCFYDQGYRKGNPAIGSGFKS